MGVMKFPFDHVANFGREILLAIDEFAAALFWWRWKQRRAEAQLESVLARHGERSFEARKAVEAVRHSDFAIRYWRSAPPEVQRIVEAADAQGIPVTDLRLMVLNRDLLSRRGRVCVRQSWLIRLLALAVKCIVFAHWLLMMAMAATASGHWSLRVLAAAVITSVYAVLYRAWSVYLSRPCAAVGRSGEQVEQILAKDNARTRLDHTRNLFNGL